MGVEQHTHAHGMTFAGEKAMSERLIPSLPVVNLLELHGKTLTLSVGQDINLTTMMRHLVVMGTDSAGLSYVLIDSREKVSVYPPRR
jgi:hypothetical protein